MGERFGRDGYIFVAIILLLYYLISLSSAFGVGGIGGGHAGEGGQLEEGTEIPGEGAEETGRLPGEGYGVGFPIATPLPEEVPQSFPISLPLDFAFFLGSCALWSFSLVLLYMSKNWEKRILPKDESTSNVVLVVTFFSITMALSYGIYILYFYADLTNNYHDYGYYILTHPKQFVPAFLIASFLPAAIAFFKFIVSASLAQNITEKTSVLAHSPSAFIIGAIFSLLNVFANIVTLFMFFFNQ
ncbi:MAG: hypothetical protein C4530_09910 [Desulfobacteraceae bacterium]|nr:MAG: hypothetical protein C4530_09910 [Desulfobacteraceae bacterium]